MAQPWQLAEGQRRRRERLLKIQRPLFESLPSLDVRALTRKGMIPGEWFSIWDFPNIGFLIPGVRSLKVCRAKIELVSVAGKPQAIPLAWRVQTGARRFRSNYARPALICGGCKRTRYKLWLGRGGDFTCKRCCGAVWASQVASGAPSRARLQAARLRSFIRQYPDTNTRLPHKPATWGWAAYDRLVARLKRLEAKEGRKRGNVVTKRVSVRLLRPMHEYGLRLSERVAAPLLRTISFREAD
jgi:hypothetical protein